METQHNTIHNHKLLRALLAAVFAAGLAVLAGPVAAEGWYVGASSGKVENRNWCDVSPAACDDKDSGWKIFAGNQLNRFVGYEFGYTDLGQLTNTGITAEADGIVVSLVGMIPVGEMFSIAARVGAFRWNSDVNSTTPSLSRSRDGTNMTLGVGAKIPLGKRIDVRVEWERYDVDDDDYSLISAGIAFNFGK
jgi:hypothetical protein